MTTPTLINLPPPPSDPVTPSEMGPGTPNSGTTSLSALSTTAIKDGHQGQPLPHGHHAHGSPSTSMASTTTLEAERADRISRLAGLERVATARAGATSQPGSAGQMVHNPGYFETTPVHKERSTVGSASVTASASASASARTTWASGSDGDGDGFDDKVSEDPDLDPEDGISSMGGNLSSEDGNSSLVGFGERVSPVSHPGRPNSLGSPCLNRMDISASQQSQQQQHSRESGGVPMTLSSTGSATPEATQDSRMVDGMTYDAEVVDTTVRTPRLATPVGGFDPMSPGSDQQMS